MHSLVSESPYFLKLPKQISMNHALVLFLHVNGKFPEVNGNALGNLLFITYHHHNKFP